MGNHGKCSANVGPNQPFTGENFATTSEHVPKAITLWRPFEGAEPPVATLYTSFKGPGPAVTTLCTPSTTRHLHVSCGESKVSTCVSLLHDLPKLPVVKHAQRLCETRAGTRVIPTVPTSSDHAARMAAGGAAAAPDDVSEPSLV